MLNYHDVKYVDDRMDSWDWYGMKSSFPNGMVPVWRELGFECDETNALQRYLQKKIGIYPEDPLKAWDVDATFSFLFE